eukprot:3537666-Prorocentrum_lima.AAC.1
MGGRIPTGGNWSATVENARSCPSERTLIYHDTSGILSFWHFVIIITTQTDTSNAVQQRRNTKKSS